MTLHFNCRNTKEIAQTSVTPLRDNRKRAIKVQTACVWDEPIQPVMHLAEGKKRAIAELYDIAYNCYDADSQPVNYYYSDDDRTAMTPGYNGCFNVFVVVRDSAGGEVQIDTGWLDLTGYEALPLKVEEEVAISEISPDGRSIFINRPTVSGGTGIYTIAYNCYDTNSVPVNYYYSSDARTAMTPGYAGMFCVFVVVSDGNESITINTGWHQLCGGFYSDTIDVEWDTDDIEVDDPYEYPEFDDWEPTNQTVLNQISGLVILEQVVVLPGEWEEGDLEVTFVFPTPFMQGERLVAVFTVGEHEYTLPLVINEDTTVTLTFSESIMNALIEEGAGLLTIFGIAGEA